MFALYTDIKDIYHDKILFWKTHGIEMHIYT